MTHYCDQTSLIKRYWPKVNQKQPLLIQVTDTNLFWLLKITNTVLKCWPGKLSIHLLRQVQHPWSVWATYLITNSHQGRQRTGFGASCIVIVSCTQLNSLHSEWMLLNFLLDGWIDSLSNTTTVWVTFIISAQRQHPTSRVTCGLRC